MKTDQNITLAIETAIDGGSLSLLKNGFEICSWTGTQQISKAEDVLEKISELLKDNKIQKSDVDFIAVSNGPGSSTGIKIGLAIAKGLGNALNIQVQEISTFEALLEGGEDSSNKVSIAVLPIGKNLLSRQIFENGRASENSENQNPRTLVAEEFRIELLKTKPAQVIFHRKAFEHYKVQVAKNTIKENFIVIEDNLAYLIGRTFYILICV